MRSIKSEYLAQNIPLGERHLRHAVKEYTEHYHTERNHQGLDNRLIEEWHGVRSGFRYVSAMKGWAGFSTITRGGPLRRSAEFWHHKGFVDPRPTLLRLYGGFDF